MTRSRAALVPACLVGLLVLTGCSERLCGPVPDGLLDRAQIPGMPDVRAWGDAYSAVIERSIIQAWAQREAAGQRPRELNLLALSGGGSYGAFGAGLLCGWSAAGNRPAFDAVTGISTGALIAPFAFVGPAYDPTLREFYTRVKTEDIFRLRFILNILNFDAAADTEPLQRLLERVVDQPLLDAVAREHGKGRRLFVGTTNLDAQRPVIWDMGAIAASGRPEALGVFRKVLMASAAIPAVFPPQYFEVEVGGKTFQEMHVDGGTTSQVFHFGQVLDHATIAGLLPGLTRDIPRRIYVIRNCPVRPEWKPVPPRVLPIASRAMATLLKANACGDLYRIYLLTQLEHAEFHLAHIPDDFVTGTSDAMFDQEEMQRLFDRGFAEGRGAEIWRREPPGFLLRPSLSPETK